jgi:hypothetical protein
VGERQAGAEQTGAMIFATGAASPAKKKCRRSSTGISGFFQ